MKYAHFCFLGNVAASHSLLKREPSADVMATSVINCTAEWYKAILTNGNTLIYKSKIGEAIQARDAWAA